MIRIIPMSLRRRSRLLWCEAASIGRFKGDGEGAGVVDGNFLRRAPCEVGARMGIVTGYKTFFFGKAR